jgi:hypothetical protein
VPLSAVAHVAGGDPVRMRMIGRVLIVVSLESRAAVLIETL